jgi:VanZ family protein
VEHFRCVDLERVEMSKARVTALVRWILVVFWMGVIFALSATPSLASPFEPIYDFILRKLAHVTVYAVLTILVYRALRLHLARPTHAWLLAMLIPALYACSDEWHQAFVPGRKGTVRDVAIDSLGIAGALALALLPRVRDVWRRWFAEEVRAISP